MAAFNRRNEVEGPDGRSGRVTTSPPPRESLLRTIISDGGKTKRAIFLVWGCFVAPLIVFYAVITSDPREVTITIIALGVLATIYMLVDKWHTGRRADRE